MLHEVDESPGHTASCLSWRTSGSLQQIFGLQTIVPQAAHPLTAEPHFDVWLHDEEDVLPLGITGPSLIDLTKKTGYFIAETAKGYIRAPFITRKRPLPRGNTAPFRSIGWVPAPAPFPTSERGHDSQRDR